MTIDFVHLFKGDKNIEMDGYVSGHIPYVIKSFSKYITSCNYHRLNIKQHLFSPSEFK